MQRGERKFSGKYSDEIERIVDGLTLFDDDLMSRVFENNHKATELLLRIAIGKALTVEDVHGQIRFESHEIEGKDIVLDIFAIGQDGTLTDIEVQSNAVGADIKRARYYSAMLDTNALKSGEDYKKIRDTYVIFICRHDPFGLGLPVYLLDRVLCQTGDIKSAGDYIIYLNGAYKGDDDYGRLMADFHQVNYRDMHFPELAEGVRFFKEDEGGRENMCDAVKEYGREQREIAEKSANVNAVKVLMTKFQFSLTEAMNELHIQGKAREAVEEELKKEKVS